jgi:hypothetical protein
MRRTIDFFRDLQLVTSPAAVYGVGSAEGLARELAKTRNVLLAYDELRTFVDKCEVRGSTLLPMVTSLFENTTWQHAVKSAKHSVSIEDAHLSLLGCCTLDTYAHVWTGDAIAIGLTNRLFIVGADRKPKVAWPKQPDTTRLRDIGDKIASQVRRLPRALKMNRSGHQEWEKWYVHSPSGEHARRLDTIGYRLLGLIALITDKDEIDRECVQTVTAILDYEHDMRVITDPIDANTQVAKLEEAIRRQLGKRGPLTARELRQHTHADRVGLWAFTSAVNNLTAAGDIEVINGRYGLRPAA